MDFIHDNCLQPLGEPAAVVEHGAQDLGGADETGRLRVQLGVPRQQTDLELRPQLAVLLVRERLHWRGVDHPA